MKVFYLRAKLLIAYCSILCVPAFAQKGTQEAPLKKQVIEKLNAPVIREEQPEVVRNYPVGFEQTAPFRKLYGVNGPLRNVKQEDEILEKRDLYSKHYRNSDGSITAMAGAGEIHYLENGLYKTILTEIVPDNSVAGYGLANNWNKFNTRFGSSFEKGVLIKYMNQEIKAWQNKRLAYLDDSKRVLQSIALSNTSSVQYSSEEIAYLNTAPFIDSRITQKTIGYETDFILNNSQAIANIPVGAKYFSVEEEIELPNGWSASYDNYKGSQVVLIKNANNQEMFSFEKPLAYESDHRATRTIGEFVFNQTGNKLSLQMILPLSWLKDPVRRFPLVLDPTTNFTPNNTSFWTGTVDEDGDCNTDDELLLGFEDGNFSNDDYQCYSKFNISSIPATACIGSAFVNVFQTQFENDRNDDNNLRFYFQAYDPLTTDPIPTSCSTINLNINTTGTFYSLWDVWGNCGGTCNDYDENSNNTWKLFNNFGATRVQNCLAQGFVVSSWDYLGGHSDPSGPDNDEIIHWAGRSSGNRPYMTIAYETASTPATSITASTLTVCPGGPLTLSLNGGSLGSNATWRWYKGGCGSGASVGSGTVLTDNPSSTTTYYVRAEGPCNTTTCTQITISVSGTINTTVTITSTPANPGPWCAGSIVTPATLLTATVLNPPLLYTGIPASATWSYRWEVSSNLGATWSCVNTLNTPTAACPWASNSAVLTYQPVPAITQTTIYRYLLNDANTGCIVSSNTLTFTVLPALGNNTILDNQTICVPPAPNNNATPTIMLGSVPTGGNGTYTYQWQESVNSVFWSDIFGQNSQSYTPASPISATRYYRRIVNSGPCTGNQSNVITVTIQQAINGNTIGTGQTYCISGDAPPLSGGVLSGGSGSYTYQWQASLDSGNTYTDIIGQTSATFDPPNLTQTTYYRRVVNSGNCTDVSNAVAINILLPISDNQISANQSSCVVPFTPAQLNGTTPSGASGTYTYQWQESIDGGANWTNAVGALPNSYSPPPVTQTTAYRRIVESLPCAANNSNVVTAAIVPAISNNSISPYQSFCLSGDPANIVGATPTGGAGAGTYTYEWQISTDLGASWSNIPLATGTDYDPPSVITTTTLYRRVVTSGLCTSTSNISRAAILSLPQILTVTKTDIACSGGNSGTITVTASTTNGNLFYSSDNGGNFQASNFFGSLGIGSYFIVVTDDSSCSRTYVGNPIIIDQSPPLSHTADSTDASCAGVYDGTITINAAGGVPPYSYSLNGGPTQPGNVFTGLSSGNYTIRVFDAFNCVDISNISVNNSYTVTGSIVSQTNVTCFGLSNGAVELLLSGGIPVFEYSLNGLIFQTNPVFTNLGAGNYIASLRDSKGCSAFVPVNITQPGLLTITIDSVRNIQCNGTSSGEIYTTVSGGTVNYTYTWSNGASSDDINGLSAGTYVLNVSDANSCTASASASISQPAALSVGIASFNDLRCFSDSTGQIDISIYGGTPSYTFLWSNGATTEDIQQLPSQSYTVTITDASACTITISQFINQPTQLTATIVGTTNVVCYNGTNGGADLQAGGGVSPYSYLWSNFDVTEDLAGVGAGTYGVVVTDTKGCTALATTTIIQPAAIQLTASSITPVLCHGASTGAISLSVNGGITPYSFVWSNGATSQNLSGVPAGNYSVVLTDGNTCTASASFTVTQSDSIIAAGSVVNPGCLGTNNGSIILNVVGGNFPYTFGWSNGSNAQNLYNLGGGNYRVTITDAALCTASISFTLTPSPSISSTVNHTDVTCNGLNNGTASVASTGGTPPFTYLWSTFQISPSVTGLDGGLYYVIVTDSVGCQRRDSVFVVEPFPLVITHVDTNISCHNANDGIIDITVTGGTLPYQFFWSNSTFNEDATGLAGGTYTVNVVDANNCNASATATIVNPSQVTANFIVSNVKCFGGADARIDLIPSGGTPGYTFVWSTGDLTEDIDSVGSGTYTVTITDAAGCSIVSSAVVAEPQPLVAYGITKPVTCFGDRDGAINYYINGGTPPYAYIWSNGSIRQSIDQLSGGMYYVTVNDANGCEVLSSFFVYEPTLLTLSTTSSNVSCFGGSNGTVAAIPGGGTKPYEYLWNNFVIDSFQTGLTAGRYVVILTDSSGCHTSDSVIVSQPTQVELSAVIVDAACNGASTGSITLAVSGGVPQYAVTWSNGGSGTSLTNIPAGLYTATVTDANGCVKTATYEVKENAGFAIDVIENDVICFGGNTGTASAIVNGGVFPYQYAWGTSPVQSGISAQQLTVGSYVVTVTDARNCTATATAVIDQPQQIVVTTNALGAQCFNTASGEVIVNVTGGVSPLTFSLNGSTQANDTFRGLLPGSYLILVTDVNGCTGNAPFVIVSPAQISVDLTVADQVILTGMNTRLTATANSTTNIVSYTWLPPSVVDLTGCTDPQSCPNPLAAPLTTTTIWVTVTDQNQCIATDSVTITVNNEPSAFIPTVFTPNGDGLNDRFEFDILGATNIGIQIFNRWGEKIFDNPSQPNGLTGNNGWDGTVDGKLAAYDTYTYQMRITYFDGVIVDKIGTITLMR
jgi:gliding motility-associated-like protein